MIKLNFDYWLEKNQYLLRNKKKGIIFRVNRKGKSLIQLPLLLVKINKWC